MGTPEAFSPKRIHGKLAEVVYAQAIHGFRYPATDPYGCGKTGRVYYHSVSEVGSCRFDLDGERSFTRR
jgi:hypothetical protein